MKRTVYYSNFSQLNYEDMATADIDKFYAGILVRKKLFLPRPRKKFKIKPIVKNGRVKHIEITAPYHFIVQLLEMMNYIPLIDESDIVENRFGVQTGYYHREEWESPVAAGITNKNKGNKRNAKQ